MNEIKLTFEEKLDEYFAKSHELGDVFINKRKKFDGLYFTDGTSMKNFWNVNKDKIIRFIKTHPKYKRDYPKIVRKLLHEYSKDFLTFEEKLEQYLSMMDKFDNEFIGLSKKYSKLLFTDGTRIGSFGIENKNKIINTLNSNSNFALKHPKSVQVLYEKYSKTKLTFEEKLIEYLEQMQKLGNKFIGYFYNRPDLYFSDGSHMNNFWFYNRDKIIKYINSNPIYKEKYPDSVKVLLEVDSRLNLDFDNKMEEYLNKMDEIGSVFIGTSCDYTFSDGVKMGFFWFNHKDKIIKAIKSNPKYAKEHPDSVNELIDIFNGFSSGFRRKLEEYISKVEEEGYVLIDRSLKYEKLMFKDKTLMCRFWNNSREDIIRFLSLYPDFVRKHKKAVKVLLDKYSMYKDKQIISDICISHDISYKDYSFLFKTLLSIPYRELDSKFKFIEELNQNIIIDGVLNEILTMSNYELQNKYNITLTDLLIRYNYKILNY